MKVIFLLIRYAAVYPTDVDIKYENKYPLYLIPSRDSRALSGKTTEFKGLKTKYNRNRYEIISSADVIRTVILNLINFHSSGFFEAKFLFIFSFLPSVNYKAVHRISPDCRHSHNHQLGYHFNKCIIKAVISGPRS